MKRSQAYKVVGRPEARLDGADKVMGKAVYTVDVELSVRMPMLGSNESTRAKRRRFRESMPLSLATIRED